MRTGSSLCCSTGHGRKEDGHILGLAVVGLISPSPPPPPPTTPSSGWAAHRAHTTPLLPDIMSRPILSIPSHLVNPPTLGFRMLGFVCRLRGCRFESSTGGSLLLHHHPPHTHTCTHRHTHTHAHTSCIVCIQGRGAVQEENSQMLMGTQPCFHCYPGFHCYQLLPLL